ncbi:alcohol acetyltransferase-domain-containing protein [Mycena filopes]|nr:alcohol acetyltransferase-domain-containing protein [Mycena filopes]
MPPLKRLRKLGLMECYHSTRHYLGLDSCVVSAAQYTTQDGVLLTPEILFPALRRLIETHSALGLRLDGNEATANVYLVRLASIDLSRIVEFCVEKKSVEDAFEAQLVRRFETQTDLPLWRVEVLPDNTLVFAAHHTVADGMSHAVFLLSLFSALQMQNPNSVNSDIEKSSSPIVPVPPSLPLIPSVDQSTTLRPSLPTIAKVVWSLLAPVSWTHARRAWTGPPSPSAPTLATRIRLLTLPPADVDALCATARAHDATLTSTLYVAALAVFSRMLLAKDEGYTRLGAGAALSLRSVAGIPEDTICDYPSVYYGLPRLLPAFSWPAAAGMKHTLRVQKGGKGREIIGMMRILCGQFVPFMNAHLGAKRDLGFCVSNLGRVQVPAGVEGEGKWSIGKTMFAQCDVAIAAALNINVCGDPDGGLNVTFSWGKDCVDAGMVERFIAGFGEELRRIIEEARNN